MKGKDKVVTGKFEDAGGFYTLQKIASEPVVEQHCRGARELPVRRESTLPRSATDRSLRSWRLQRLTDHRPGSLQHPQRQTKGHDCIFALFLFFLMKYLGVSERMEENKKGDGVGFACFPVGVERLSPEMKKVTISYSVMHSQNVGSVVKIYLGGGKS